MTRTPGTEHLHWPRTPRTEHRRPSAVSQTPSPLRRAALRLIVLPHQPRAGYFLLRNIIRRHRPAEPQACAENRRRGRRD